MHLNFADPDKVPVLLDDVRLVEGASIFEPAEGGRGDADGGALQLQRTVHRDGQLLRGAAAGDLRRLCTTEQSRRVNLLHLEWFNCIFICILWCL